MSNFSGFDKVCFDCLNIADVASLLFELVAQKKGVEAECWSFGIQVPAMAVTDEELKAAPVVAPLLLGIIRNYWELLGIPMNP